jgi:hypothetical protein
MSSDLLIVATAHEDGFDSFLGPRSTIPETSENRRNTRLAEVIAFEQEGFAGNLGERIGETVAEVQAGCVAAFAEIRPGLSGRMRLFLCDGLDANARGSEERVPLALPAKA